MLCAIRGTGRTLDFALREARETGRRLYLLFVREQRFMTDQDTSRKWQDDPEARAIFENARARSSDQPPLFCYAVSDSAVADDCGYCGNFRRVAPYPRRPPAPVQWSTSCVATSSAKSPIFYPKKLTC